MFRVPAPKEHRVIDARFGIPISSIVPAQLLLPAASRLHQAIQTLQGAGRPCPPGPPSSIRWEVSCKPLPLAWHKGTHSLHPLDGSPNPVGGVANTTRQDGILAAEEKLSS
jgi:hypothetical protein